MPATLDETLARSRFVFVLATVTDESRHLLGARELDLLPDGARLVLVSRAPVVDFPALLARVAEGRLLAGIDVWPEEPVAADDPARGLEGLVLSAHRAGGIPEAFPSIGDMVRRRPDPDRPGPAARPYAGRRARTRRPLPQPSRHLKDPDR